MKKERVIVYLIDDEKEVLDSLTFLLESVQYQVEVYTDALELIAKIDDLSSLGCIVSDVRMPGMSGLALQQALIKLKCKLPLILVTGHGDIGMATQAMKAGALDFLTKPINNQRFLDAVYQGIEISRQNIETAIVRKAHENQLNKLTAREREVLKEMVDGKTTKQIAKALFISVNTVEIHRTRIKEKLECSSINQIYRYIFQNNLNILI